MLNGENHQKQKILGGASLKYMKNDKISKYDKLLQYNSYK